MEKVKKYDYTMIVKASVISHKRPKQSEIIKHINKSCIDAVELKVQRVCYQRMDKSYGI